MPSFPKHLKDRFGKQYSAELFPDDIGFVVKVWDGNMFVAQAWCIESSPFELTNLEVFNDVLTPRPVWLHLLRNSLRIPNFPVNYRNRGIAGSLLDAICNYAAASGADEIFGKIVDRDLNANPWLARWYKSKGFIVTQDGVGPISKKLVSLQPR